MSEKKRFLKDFPAQNKDNFKIYHEADKLSSEPIRKQDVCHKNSIYPTTPDVTLDQKIVNEPRPQVTLRYLDVRGKQYSLQSQSGRQPIKRKKTSNSAKV